MKLGARYQILIASILVVVVVGGFILFLEMPKISEFKELDNKKKKSEKEIKTARADIDRLEALLKEQPATNAKLEEIKVKMPSDPQLSTIIREVDRIAREAGVHFESIKPADPIQQAQYTEIPAEVVVKGRFNGVVDFIYRVFTLSRKIKTTSVDIKATDPGLPFIEVKLNISAFMFGQASQSAGAGASGGTSGASESSGESGSQSGQQESP